MLNIIIKQRPVYNPSYILGRSMNILGINIHNFHRSLGQYNTKIQRYLLLSIIKDKETLQNLTTYSKIIVI